MNRDTMIKIIISILMYSISFQLIAYFFEGNVLSVKNYFSYLMLAAVGGSIGAVYGYFEHGVFFKSPFISGFIPALFLMITSVYMELGDMLAFGDLCIMITCWFTASDVIVANRKVLIERG